jgi:hypothetical protein
LPYDPHGHATRSRHRNRNGRKCQLDEIFD